MTEEKTSNHDADIHLRCAAHSGINGKMNLIIRLDDYLIDLED